MDRSNILIGAGVLLGLGTLAYWLMNREGGTAATSADKARMRTSVKDLQKPNAVLVPWRSAATRAGVIANRGLTNEEIPRSDF